LFVEHKFISSNKLWSDFTYLPDEFQITTAPLPWCRKVKIKNKICLILHLSLQKKKNSFDLLLWLSDTSTMLHWISEAVYPPTSSWHMESCHIRMKSCLTITIAILSCIRNSAFSRLISIHPILLSFTQTNAKSSKWGTISYTNLVHKWYCTYPPLFTTLISDINHISRKITICSNSTMLRCYSAAIVTTWQHIVPNSISRNNNHLFKFAIAAIWQHWPWLS